MRWMLFYPDFFYDLTGIRTNPGPNELTFSWAHEYVDVDDDHILQINVIERDLFHDRDCPERTGDVYYIGKALYRGIDTPPVPGARHITKAWPETRAGMAEVLRESRILWCYDDDTMLVDEALYCGCRVIILPAGVERYRADLRVPYSTDELDEQIERFIRLTQEVYA